MCSETEVEYKQRGIREKANINIYVYEAEAMVAKETAIYILRLWTLLELLAY